MSVCPPYVRSIRLRADVLPVSEPSLLKTDSVRLRRLRYVFLSLNHGIWNRFRQITAAQISLPVVSAINHLNVICHQRHKERPVRSHRSLTAGGGARTHTPFLTTDFESVSSANSDTPAQEPLTAAPYRLYHLICFLSNRCRALCFSFQPVKRTL